MIDQKLKNSPALLEEIKKALQKVNYGSVEIYVQDKKVTQLTIRSIQKTSIAIDEDTVTAKSDKSHTRKTNGMNVKTINFE